MRFTNIPARSFISIAIALLIAAPTHAHQREKSMRATIGSHIEQWLNNPLVVDAIKRQNAEQASLSLAGIEYPNHRVDRRRDGRRAGQISRSRHECLYVQTVRDQSTVRDDKALPR